MSEFEPKENTNCYNNKWNEVEAMAGDYNKSVVAEDKERTELNRQTMELIANDKKASGFFKKLASSALISVMLIGAGLTMGITAGNVVADQARAEQLNKVSNSVATFIDDNGTNKPWKIYTQPVDDDGVVHGEKTFYHDEVTSGVPFAEQLESALPELNLEKSNWITVEWRNGDRVYMADDVNCDGSWNIISCTNVDASWGEGPYFMADEKSGDEIPEAWSTMTGVEQYFAENAESE